MTALAPYPVQQYTDSNGLLLSGGKLFTYAAGTTTKLAVYTDSTGATPFSNPIILNTRGEPTNPGGFSCGIWLTPGVNYKFVLAPSTDTDPPTNAFWTVDQISTPAALTTSALVDSGSANAYVVAFSPAPANLPAILNVPFSVRILTANTGASTINVNGFGASPITRRDGSALIGGELLAGQFVTLMWTGTSMQLQGVAPATVAVTAAGTDTQSAVTPADLTSALRAGGYLGGSQQSFTSSGTFTVPAGVLLLRFYLIGGGGGGAATSTCTGSQVSAGPGGNGGARCQGEIVVTPGQVGTITVGAFGAAGVTGGANGQAGGTTTITFGANTATAPGGHGAANAAAASSTLQVQAPPAVTNISTGGTLNDAEFSGGPGIGMTAANVQGGAGGGSGGGSATGGTAAGNSAITQGGGGGGAATLASGSGQNGGAGGGGLVWLYW